MNLPEGIGLLDAHDLESLKQAQIIIDHAFLKVALRSELELEQTRIFIAHKQDAQHEVIAVLVCWRVADEVEVIDLAVSARERRKGRARQLLLSGLIYEQSFGAKTAFLEVRADNLAAKSLYESLGFQLSGERKSYYSDGVDAELYCLELKELN